MNCIKIYTLEGVKQDGYIGSLFVNMHFTDMKSLVEGHVLERNMYRNDHTERCDLGITLTTFKIEKTSLTTNKIRLETT